MTLPNPIDFNKVPMKDRLLHLLRMARDEQPFFESEEARYYAKFTTKLEEAYAYFVAWVDQGVSSTEEVNPLEKLKAGSLVEYVRSKDEQHIPAIVLKVNDIGRSNGCCNLLAFDVSDTTIVMLNAQAKSYVDQHILNSRFYSDKYTPGTWHWPSR